MNEKVKSDGLEFHSPVRACAACMRCGLPHFVETIQDSEWAARAGLY